MQDVRAHQAAGLTSFRYFLTSDFLLVQMTGQAHYVEFRDVFEVDGQPVRDRQDRLTKLFLNPAASQPDFETIVAESARYNIGRVTRTVNTPTLPLLFLDPRVQSRFKFKLATDGAPVMVNGSGRSTSASSSHFSVSTEVWVVEYQEVDRGTVIRTPKGKGPAGAQASSGSIRPPGMCS